jgi:hypothetical protein
MNALLLLLIFALLPRFAPAVERQEGSPELARVKRVYVDQLGGGAMSDQMRDMIMAALQNSGLFIVTEKPESADATIRGSADDKVFNEEHDSSDSIGLRTNTGNSGSSRSNMTSSVSSSRSAGAGVTDSESNQSKERRHEASASIRLVDASGDVIWSTTQESGGGKFRGALADVADKIARQLTEDTRRARRSAAVAEPPKPDPPKISPEAGGH